MPAFTLCDAGLGAGRGVHEDLRIFRQVPYIGGVYVVHYWWGALAHL